MAGSLLLRCGAGLPCSGAPCIFLRVPSPLPPSPSSVCAIAVPYQLPSRLNSPLFSVPGRPLASFSFHRCWSSAMAPRCILSCPIGCWLVRRSVWVRDHELFDRCHPRSCRPPPARASPLSLPPLPTSISLSSSLDALFGVPLPRKGLQWTGSPYVAFWFPRSPKRAPPPNTRATHRLAI